MNTPSFDPLDDIVATIPLGDPLNTSIKLSGRDLCQNVLATGMIGSGKTTSVIYNILKDAIAFRAGEEDRKIGVFVFDSKCDGTTERVEAWAGRCGRADDVVVLRPGSPWGFDPVGGESLLSETDIVAAKLQAGFEDVGSDNQYWTETMRTGIEAVLALDLLEHGALELNRTLQTLESVLLWSASSRSDARQMVDSFATRCGEVAGHIDPNATRVLSAYATALKNWVALDPKTGGILQSCVNNAIRPLLSPRVLDYYPICGRKAFDVSEVVTRGKILVLQANAAADKALARTLGRLVKADIYRALQRRAPQAGSAERLVGLFFDEYPLVATSGEPFFGDVMSLQTLREKRGFIVAGTQGYISMRTAIGDRSWEALRINFATSFFLKSNEPEVEEHARTILGKREVLSSVQVNIESHDTLAGGVATASESRRKMSVEGEQYIIGRGALARLEAHEAFYAAAGGEIGESSVFILPVFEDFRSRTAPEAPNPVDVAASICRHAALAKENQNVAVDAEPVAVSAPPVAVTAPTREAAGSCCSEDEPDAWLVPYGNLTSVDLLSLHHYIRNFDHQAREFPACQKTKTELEDALKEEERFAAWEWNFTDFVVSPEPMIDTLECDLPFDYARLLLRGPRRAGRRFFKAVSQKNRTCSVLAREARYLYRSLNFDYPPKTAWSAAAEAAGEARKVLCQRLTGADLSAVPAGLFGPQSVAFFTAIDHPVNQILLPRLVEVIAEDGMAVAVFSPRDVGDDNVLTVSAAMLCFAVCMRPSET